ncbi:zinc finger BED domain-containing protein RICESLEEPER 2-like [Dorcoceras hygrometricum]|uniref:Zinc finger BED domain-containing protein RICESLEEPER 2-like n=1 Tax=Dorcoceras hygrometricum TaxID=472368 RepID=A0A2Z7B0L2_9LAMI|nr:zinc finger BED domain-containing protein RICESLEEPER 2-like [Dorcoceras hygrometricum]
MCIGCVLDPRCKMRVLEFIFPTLYPDAVARDNVTNVRNILSAIFKEYVDATIENLQESSNLESQGSNHIRTRAENSSGSSSGWFEFSSFLRETEMLHPEKSELDIYLEEGCHLFNPEEQFDALSWWKLNTYKFRILSSLARDVLAIPITTVASEATFSAGSRVIDKYRFGWKAGMWLAGRLEWSEEFGCTQLAGRVFLPIYFLNVLAGRLECGWLEGWNGVKSLAAPSWLEGFFYPFIF